jgi:hypothetical protein
MHLRCRLPVLHVRRRERSLHPGTREVLNAVFWLNKSSACTSLVWLGRRLSYARLVFGHLYSLFFYQTHSGTGIPCRGEGFITITTNAL